MKVGRLTLKLHRSSDHSPLSSRQVSTWVPGEGRPRWLKCVGADTCMVVMSDQQTAMRPLTCFKVFVDNHLTSIHECMQRKFQKIVSFWRTFTLATSRHGWCPHRMAVPFRNVPLEPHLIRFTAGPLMHVRLSVHSSWVLLIVTQSRPQKFMHVHVCCMHACAYPQQLSR